MKVSKFIAKYSLDDVLKIEQNDSQNLAIKHAWETIRDQYGDSMSARNSFLYLLIQTALVSYQVAGSWPLWWDEITQKIAADFGDVWPLLREGQCPGERWYKTLTNSHYNKRLYNNKRNRLVRFYKYFGEYFNVETIDYEYFYNDMKSLLQYIMSTTKATSISKTAVFAIKIFGYGARRVYDDLKIFPMDISIPLDSRLRKIWKLELGEVRDTDLLNWFNELWKKHGIPPLHLDSLLRIEYWNIYVLNW